jgi:hypothetical protein
MLFYFDMESIMTSMVKSLPNFQFRTTLGITNSLDGSTVYPKVTKTLYVSFATDDCKSTLVGTLIKEQLDAALDIFSNAGLVGDVDNLALPEKQSLLLNTMRKYPSIEIPPYNAVKKLASADITYIKKLMAQLGCLVGLDFEFVNGQEYKAYPGYKTAICGIKGQMLAQMIRMDAMAFINIENQDSCAIIIDDNKNIRNNFDLLTQNRENILGHEFMHCLGLSHPAYGSLDENKQYNSIIEDNSPIITTCASKSGNNFIQHLKCINPPAMPTHVDIATLIGLFGHSENQTESCEKIRENFVLQYPQYVELTNSGVDSTQYGEL